MENTYKKFAPNVFVAKCSKEHEKGETIILTTKYGKEHECTVFNLVKKDAESFYYSIVRNDGFNYQSYMIKKAERLKGFAETAKRKGNEYYEKSQKGKDFLVLGEPIKVGHHSEKRHRKLIEDNHRNFGKYIEQEEKKNDYVSRAEYWEKKANEINLSMPESIEYYNYEYDKAKEYHEGLKSGKYKREHAYSLTYAKKKVNELEKKLKLANILWG